MPEKAVASYIIFKNLFFVLGFSCGEQRVEEGWSCTKDARGCGHIG